MRLKFKATKRKPTHLANYARFFDGNVRNVPTHSGIRLLKSYPRNFFEVETIDREAILNKIIKIFEPDGGYEIKGMKVTQNGKLKVDYDDGR